jgi:hypothetical protein
LVPFDTSAAMRTADSIPEKQGSCPPPPQTAYLLRDVFRNVTGSDACYGIPAATDAAELAAAEEECGFHWFSWTPFPVLTSNSSARLTTVEFRFQPDADGGEVPIGYT